MNFSDEGILRAFASEGGALIEIYLRNTTFEDWVQVVSDLAAEGYSVVLTLDDAVVPVSISRGMFDDDTDASWNLRVKVGKQDWSTSFFSVSDIDFQGNPEPITSGADLVDVRRFMGTLARATGKTAILISESIDPDAVKPYIEIYPDSSANG